jgi:hypothetical protein
MKRKINKWWKRNDKEEKRHIAQLDYRSHSQITNVHGAFLLTLH